MGFMDSAEAIVDMPNMLLDMMYYGGIAVLATIVFVGIALGIGQIRNPASVSLSASAALPM